MCGICGIVATGGTPVREAVLERMALTLRHRGPDDGAVYVSRAPGSSAGLAHRRLSIIDLSSAGRQPMANEDGTVWLTYNGEIYNHAELRRQLEPAGHRYRSHTDSETILHAYEEWGDRCMERLRGMFAFAIWDERERRLLLVRDRLGVKPLYYAVVNGTIVFASEIKAILESGLIDASPAEGALSEYLGFGYLAGEETMFAGIRKLPPGHFLVWQDGAVRVERYWQLRFATNGRMRAGDAAGRLRELFEQSVRMRLMSDVPLGIFLSGGLDSSAIAAVAARMLTEPIKTFSVGFPAAYYSEFPFAREVAQAIGADHHETVLTADRFFDAVPRLVWHEDEPLWGTASVALYFVSKLAAGDVKVVLTGEGSDELFAGYDRYWMTALNARAWSLYRRLPHAGRALLRRAISSDTIPERARRALGHTFLAHDNLPDGLVLDNWFGVFPPEWQRELAGPVLARSLEAADPYRSRRDIFTSAEAATMVDRFLSLDVQTSLVELLMKQDQMSMATSIESRVPFLDHELVEFAATIPSSLKIRGVSGKHVLKQAFDGILPHSILHRKKMGFPVPWDAWLRESFLPRIETLLLEDRALDRGWLRADAVRALVTGHRSGRVNVARQIWALWGLEIWARLFLDRDRAMLDDARRSDAHVASVAAAVAVP